MSFVDTATAARPNGTAGVPSMAPPPDERPTADPAERATDAARLPAIAPQTAPRRHLVIGFDGVSRRVLDADAYAALRARARRKVEGTTQSQYEIARSLDISTTTLSYWKRREGWTRPAGAPLPPRLGPALPPGEKSEARRLRMIGRLYRVFERQTADLEARAVQPDATTDEKDARALSVLAKTLETLIALDRDDGAKTAKPESVDRADYKAELARYLSRWADGIGQPGEAEEGADKTS